VRYRMLRGYRYEHMHMIPHQMPLFYLALFLLGQPMKYLA
jgi:hypothetical protein